MPLLFARVHARQGAPGGMELYYSYKACTGTQVKYTEKTCPWSLDAGFNAGTVSFDFHADHSFCDIDDEHPFLGYSGLFASELVSPSPTGARLPRASSFLASKASRVETPAHARQSRQAERETRRYACSKHSGCRTSGGMTLHAALNGIMARRLGRSIFPKNSSRCRACRRCSRDRGWGRAACASSGR